MVVKGVIKKGEYFDSVTLMTVAKRLNQLPGVKDSAVVMGTKENKSILEASGLLLAEFRSAQDADLLIAVKAADDKAVSSGLEKAEVYLRESRKRSSSAAQMSPRSVEGAVKLLPDANLVLISIAGRYAGDVAMECLEKGLHVMLFSDNVSLEKEIELKKVAQSKGLLVMGPDCGTAIINGVPLAFANVVNRGNIGVVAAAGTGLQEVSTLISNAGGGISQALGTGGRDVKKDVGGISFLQGLNALVEDKTTKVVLLVSKPPYPDVLKKILAEIKKVKKPVVSIFLGGDTAGLRKAGVHAFDTLEEAALAAVSLSGGGKTDKIAAQLAARDKKLESLAKAEAKRLAKGQKFCRGLFSGGTFCSEALLILSEMLGDVHSNIPLKPGLKLQNSMKSVANTVIDMGEDEFTVGRPHPMIDYSLRNKKILEEANASETAVILLDVVLGYGSTPQPLEDILPALQEAFAVVRKNRRGLSVVCSVTGTDKDPQNRSKVVQGLEKAGCLVQPSNAAACRLAGRIVKSANV